MVDGDDLAGGHVAHELRAQHVEGARLARYDPAVAQTADRQRAQSVLVAAGIDAVGRHDQEREGALEHVQRIDDGEDAGPVAEPGLLLDQVGQNLAIGRRLEEAALVLKVVAQEFRIDDVPVVRHGEIARIVTEKERLHVLDAAASGRRVAHVADGHVAAQRSELLLVEDLGNQAVALDAAERAVVHGHDSGALLSAMLQCVEAVIGQRRGIGHPEDAEHAALLMQLAVLNQLHHRLFGNFR